MPANGGVEVKESQIKGAGNGLFARNAFSPGDTVVTVDRPLMAELEINRMLDTCAWCCQRAATDPLERTTAASIGLPTGFVEIKKCTGCQRVGYCSKTCQSKAWKREHKYECKVLSTKDRPDLPPGVRAAVKILGRLKANPDKEITSVREILGLRPAVDPNGLNKISIQDKKKFDGIKLLADAAWHYSGRPQINGLDAQSSSTGLVFNIMSNAFNLSSPFDNVKLGVGFEPLVSIANHSCDPNAILVFNQPQLQIRALRAIKPGDEIFINYLEATDPFTMRQVGLKDNYLFTCQCTKCKKGAGPETNPSIEQAKKLGREHRELADKLIGFHESRLSRYLVPGGDVEAQRRAAAIQIEAYAMLENEDAGLDDIKELIQVCIDSKVWSWTRQPVPQLCRRLLDFYIKAGGIYQAFRLGVKLHVEILPALYAEEFYPDRLINAWVTSTLINVLCGPAHQELYQELARGGLDLRLFYFGFLFYVYDHTPRMFGLESPFGKVIENTYKQIMAGVTIPNKEIRQRVQATWSSLESIAHNVDVSVL
ncbi:SET domain-containing protein [Xylaria intraflava]|nr:SET domain-containing protein [Xylaria intraflava]